MSKCAICGRDIPSGQAHIIYAFVTETESDFKANELCALHTDRLILAMKGIE